MKNTKEWWEETKSKPEALNRWLVRQYVGEMAAVNLLSQALIQYGGDMTGEEWSDVFKVMMQEAKHARWVRQLLEKRSVLIPPKLSATRKYWNEVLPEIKSLDDVAHAAHHAESMRLHRIREIAEEQDTTYADLQVVFSRILPDEEWHERVFRKLRRSGLNPKMEGAHLNGLKALSLILS